MSVTVQMVPNNHKQPVYLILTVFSISMLDYFMEYPDSNLVTYWPSPMTPKLYLLKKKALCVRRSSYWLSRQLKDPFLFCGPENIICFIQRGNKIALSVPETLVKWGKGKHVPVCATKAHWGSRDISPFILFSALGNWMVSSRSSRFTRRKEHPRVGRFKEEKNVSLLPWIQPKFPESSAFSWLRNLGSHWIEKIQKQIKLYNALIRYWTKRSMSVISPLLCTQ